MDDLVHYVQTRDLEPFAPQEYNEVLRFLYGLIGVAARDGADTLTLTPTELRWTRHGETLHAFPIDLVRPRVSYRDELHRILERDAIVQRYVQVVDVVDGVETYHLGDAATSAGDRAGLRSGGER